MEGRRVNVVEWLDSRGCQLPNGLQTACRRAWVVNGARACGRACRAWWVAAGWVGGHSTHAPRTHHSLTPGHGGGPVSSSQGAGQFLSLHGPCSQSITLILPHKGTQLALLYCVPLNILTTQAIHYNPSPFDAIFQFHHLGVIGDRHVVPCGTPTTPPLPTPFDMFAACKHTYSRLPTTSD